MTRACLRLLTGEVSPSLCLNLQLLKTQDSFYEFLLLDFDSLSHDQPKRGIWKFPELPKTNSAGSEEALEGFSDIQAATSGYLRTNLVIALHVLFFLLRLLLPFLTLLVVFLLLFLALHMSLVLCLQALLVTQFGLKEAKFRLLALELAIAFQVLQARSISILA